MIERFTLPARLDTSGAATLGRSLLSRRGHGVDLDASGVEVLGARAVEVLIAAGRQWAEDGVPLAVVAMSERYTTTCAALGLSAEMPWGGAIDAKGSAT